LFEEHILGENILGTKESVEAFEKKDIKEFISKNYNTHEIVFAVSGNYKSAQVIKLAEKYLGIIPENNTAKARLSPAKSQKKEVKQVKPISQSHCIIGNQAFSFHDDRKYGLSLLNNLLGGNGMSSRLNMEIREKNGIAYTVESSYTALSDTGIFSVYFGTDEEKAHKAAKIVHKELKKLRDNKLGSVQLHQAKQRFIGQIALGEENRMGVLISMAKSLIDFNRIDSLEEVFAKINKVSAEELLATANEVFDPSELNTLIFVPEGE